MAGRWHDPERAYEIARGGVVAARGTLSLLVRTARGWSAVFTTATSGLDGDYELRLPDGTAAAVSVRDLRESVSEPSLLTGEVPYGNLRSQTYAISGEGDAFLI